MSPAIESATTCPECSAHGKPVKPVTIESLLTPDALEQITDTEGWRFCRTASCQTAYFSRAGEQVSKVDVRVRIGQKETTSPRPLCYCFDYSLEDVQSAVASSGTSSIADTITEKCRQGLDRCPETNPQGSCCLGNVRAAEKAATAQTTATEDDPTSCCPPSPPARPDRAGTLASVGAVVSAVLSSACCWLPLLLVAVGVSAGSVSGFLDAYRPWLLGVTGGLLAVAFYLTYFRKEACDPASTCAAPSTRLQQVNKVMLWVATVLVAAFALFPNYVGAFLDDGSVDLPPAAADSLEVVEVDVQGMTCEACAVSLTTALEQVSGVRRVAVSFPNKLATLHVTPNTSREEILQAIRETGYQGTVRGETPRD